MVLQKGNGGIIISEEEVITLAFDIYSRRHELGLSLEEIGNRVGVSKSTVKKWESGYIENMKRDKIALLAEVLRVSPLEILGIKDESFPSNIVPVTGTIAILGSIRCGEPMFAEENIEGYVPTIRSHPEDYFALRAKGDSMIGAGITDGSIVVCRKQDYAEDGDIVACGVNRDEATLKRFRCSGNAIILMPENSAYSPIVLSQKDFDDGSACIYGVAVEVTRAL